MPISSVPQSSPIQRPTPRPISRAQIEVVASRAFGVFGLAFGAQTLPVALAQQEHLTPLWFAVFAVSLFGGLLLTLIASVAKRFVKVTTWFVAIAILIAMVTWPIGVVDGAWTSIDRPWLWFLITVSTAAAAVSMSTWLATFYLFLMPILYGIIRVSPAGGAANPGLALLDVIYAIILGGAVLIILTMLRGAAAAVDAAQSAALGRYVNAVREHAIEVERVQVDSIVHDSVLTTLLSTARADTPEAKELATTMARSAIGHLQAESSMQSEESRPVSLSSLGLRIAMAASTLSSVIDVRRGALGDGQVPAAVAEAIYSASIQAMVNSLQHSGGSDGTTHWVSIATLGSGDLLIEVGDTGQGFDVSEVPIARLGLRVSIIERVANAGGAVDVDSVIGEGTAIRIRWPRPVGWAVRS